MIRRPPRSTLFPTRRSSDLSLQACADDPQVAYHAIRDLTRMARGVAQTRWTVLGFGRDRKSTRLNSSHMSISYAVFCLKKKKTDLEGDPSHKADISVELLAR